MVQFKAGEDRDLSIPTRVTASGNAVTISGNQVIAKTSGEIVTNFDEFDTALHDGAAYSVSFADTDADITSGAIIYAVFPISGEYHVNFEGAAGGAGLLELWDEAVVESAGTVLIAHNFNRVSTNSSIVNWYYNPLKYTSGTGNLLWTGRIGADQGPVKAGGPSSPKRHWVFQSGTTLFLYRPDADNKTATLQADYWEDA